MIPPPTAERPANRHNFASPTTKACCASRGALARRRGRGERPGASRLAGIPPPPPLPPSARSSRTRNRKTRENPGKKHAKMPKNTARQPGEAEAAGPRVNARLHQQAPRKRVRGGPAARSCQLWDWAAAKKAPHALVFNSPRRWARGQPAGGVLGAGAGAGRSDWGW
jgi:hypothetical protein